MTYYLAIDIGASSGRHILGWLEDGKLCSQEVYRFENGFLTENDSLVWDLEHLVAEVKNGIKQCAAMGKIPRSVSIDTWGVDYVLLDEADREILPAYCYRDSRTQAAVEAVEAILDPATLYHRTGTQRQNYNTIYQLYADKTAGRLDKAAAFLQMPAYLAYKLCGVKWHEYTIAGTAGLISAETKDWDSTVIDALGFDRRLFTPLHQPGERLGSFTDEVQAEVGFNASVVFAAGHDTASAVAATPLSANDAYISSGTWSLIGIESDRFIVSDEGCAANFGNELGAAHTVRYLKNYMGMWLLQSIRKNLNKSLTYDEMMHLAEGCDDYTYFDVNDPALVAPDNMIEAIRAVVARPELPLESVLASVYHSLARSYKNAIAEVEHLTGRTIDTIRIVGGGCQDAYLNRLTGVYTGKTVTAGPVEATAVGNLVAQLIGDGVCADLAEARALVVKSFDIQPVA